MSARAFLVDGPLDGAVRDVAEPELELVVERGPAIELVLRGGACDDVDVELERLPPLVYRRDPLPFAVDAEGCCRSFRYRYVRGSS